MQRIFWLALRLGSRINIEGLENVPRSGPLIVAPNHLHITDSIVVSGVIPRRLTAFAADTWRGTIGGWIMETLANAIYVARGEPDRHALRQALAVLNAGGSLAVAPEGTRSRRGGLLPGKDGAAYLASRAGAPILPVALWGQEQVFNSWRRLRRPAVHVSIAEPIYLPQSAARARSTELQEYTDRVMLTLARILPESYRGAYAERVSNTE